MSSIKYELWNRSLIRRVIDSGRVAHAYLFLGPDQQKKIWTAISMAKALMCSEPGAFFCDQCPTCKKINSHNHPDVLWLRPSGARREIKIEMARSIQATLSLKSYEGGKKVAILIDADRMNTEAANSMLKTIEEPADNTYLILIATDVERFLPTIVSRCQQVYFPLEDRSSIVDFLASECHVEPSRAEVIASLAYGSYSEAIKYLDDDRLEWREYIIDLFFRIFHSENDIFELAETCEKRIIDRAELSVKNIPPDQAGATPDGSDVTSMERASVEKSVFNEEVSVFFQILELCCRDFIIYNETGDAELLVNSDKVEALSRYARGFSMERLLRCMVEIGNAFKAYQGNTKLQFVLEILFDRIQQELVA
ncbi:MAG: DNA polymerase III subunit delta' [Candidatus Auribacterota bacterium]